MRIAIAALLLGLDFHSWSLYLAVALIGSKLADMADDLKKQRKQ